MGFGTLVLAWALSMPAFVGLIWLNDSVRGTGRAHFLEALLGVGVLLLVPSGVFALIAGWPAIFLLVDVRPAWITPLAASAGLTLIMWGLTRIFMRTGWAGFEQTLIGYAAVFGMVLGILTAGTS